MGIFKIGRNDPCWCGSGVKYKMCHEAFDQRLKELKAQGIRINIMKRPAPTNTSKEQRVFDKAADIREHMHFLEEGYRSKEYQMFMQNVYSFTMTGRNKHDDAPDSLCIAINMAFFPVARASALRR